MQIPVAKISRRCRLSQTIAKFSWSLLLGAFAYRRHRRWKFAFCSLVAQRDCWLEMSRVCMYTVISSYIFRRYIRADLKFMNSIGQTLDFRPASLIDFHETFHKVHSRRYIERENLMNSSRYQTVTRANEAQHFESVTLRKK